MKKTLTLLLASILTATLLVSCGAKNGTGKRLCANPWASDVDILQFTESGKLLHNFESEEDSTSYYKLQKGGKINMYTEEGEEYGMLFDYRFEDGNLYIGEAEYRPLEPSIPDSNGNTEKMESREAD